MSPGTWSAVVVINDRGRGDINLQQSEANNFIVEQIVSKEVLYFREINDLFYSFAEQQLRVTFFFILL